MTDQIQPDTPPSPVPLDRAWIGGLEVGRLTARSLHGDDGKGAIMKAWTGRPETFRVKVHVPDKAIAGAGLDVRLRIRRLENEREGAASAETQDLPMFCRGEEGNDYLFEAEARFDSPGFFNLTAVCTLPTERGAACDLTAFDKGSEAQVIVHPGWVREARIFEAYTRYFGARRDPSGDVITGRIRDLIESVEWFRNLGFDALWSMGVFDRGRKEIKGIGSPYAIREHRKVEADVGTPEELQELGEALHGAGLKFGVDFVGNQTSWDCELLGMHPEWYEGMQVTGWDANRSDQELSRRHPRYRVVHAKGHRWLIRHGHSRYEEWHDVAQLNWNVHEVREHMRETVLDLIRRFDVDFFRCDMAMLIQKWQRYEEDGEERWEKRWPGMETEWWREVIAAAVQLKPEIVFIAEVYWGNDRYLQELGFALTYDHGFYHHLTGEKWGRDIISYLEGQQGWLPPGAATLHYIENHDELRAGATTGAGRLFSALMNLFTENGAVMVYNGQMEGEPLKPSLDAPWHDAPGFAVDEARWKLHEEMLYLGRRHPEFRRGDTIHLPVGEESPYRALIRILEPTRSMIVAVNHSTDMSSPTHLLLRLPAVLGIVDDEHTLYLLCGETVSPGLAGEDPLLFEPVEYLRTGRSLVKEGLPLALRGNSGCFLRILPAPERPAPRPAAYGSAAEMAADLKGVVRFDGNDVLFEEFLIFKHEKLAPVAAALAASEPALRASAMRLLLAYSRIVSPFPQHLPVAVRSPSAGEIFLSLGDEGRFALCLPANVVPAEMASGSARTWVGEKRYGLVPLYLEGVTKGSEIALKIEVLGDRPIRQRDHLLMKNREFERISRRLTIVCRKPEGETIFLEEGAVVEIEVVLEGAIEDDRRISVSIDTTLAGNGPDPLQLGRDEETGSYTTPSFPAEIDGWHPLTPILVDEWTGITRRGAREIGVNVVPAWSVGFNAYTIWLRHIRQPGKGADARADFADLRWNIDHARAMGFNVVLLLPLTDCLGSSPYEQICAMALDPAFLNMEEFLREAPACLFPEEGDLSARGEFKAFVAGHEWISDYADVKAIRILTYEDLLYKPEAGGFHHLLMRVVAASGGQRAEEFSPQAYQGMDEEAMRTTEVYQALRRLLPVQQYFAHRQLGEVIRHAHRIGVKVLFDQPLFPGSRSAEVLHHPERFVAEREITSPDGTQTWPFVRYDWDYERARGYEDYLAPFAYFIDELGFDGFRWDAFHTILLDGQEELLRRMAARFNGRGILKLGEQLGANEAEVNPLLLRYGYLLYLVPWWYPGGGFADSVEKLEERIMLADAGNWWLASTLHDHPRIAEWYLPLVARYGRLPRQHQAALVRAILALFAFFPNFIIFYGSEYAARQRINTPGDAGNTWDAPPPWAKELGNPDLTGFVGTLNRVRERYPELCSPGGRMILDSDAKAHGVSSFALVAGDSCFVLIISFSPKRISARVKVPLDALGIDPGRPFALRELLTGREMKFLPDINLRKEEGAIMVSLRFGDVYLFRAASDF